MNAVAGPGGGTVLAGSAPVAADPPVYAAALCLAVAVWLLGPGGEARSRGRLLLAGGVPRRDGGSPLGSALGAGRGDRRASGEGSGALWRRIARWVRSVRRGSRWSGVDTARLPRGGAGAGLVARSVLGRGRLGPQWGCLRLGPPWGCLLAGAVLAWLGRSPLPLVAGVLAVPLAARWLHGRAGRQEGERREAAVIEWCSAVAGELRAGRQPEQALLVIGASELGADGPAVLAAARFGGDVPGALRAAAVRPGAGGLGAVAACWQVARDGGAGLAEGLDRVTRALEAERDQRAELRAQLAGPRATAVVLALLPLFGLLLGSAMGAQPLVVLLHSPAGLGCLLLGGLLEWAGLAWVGRIVRGAQRTATEAPS